MRDTKREGAVWECDDAQPINWRDKSSRALIGRCRVGNQLRFEEDQWHVQYMNKAFESFLFSDYYFF